MGKRKDEKTSKKIGKIAGQILASGNYFDFADGSDDKAWKKIQSVAASALTQSPDHYYTPEGALVLKGKRKTSRAQYPGPMGYPVTVKKKKKKK